MADSSTADEVIPGSAGTQATDAGSSGTTSEVNTQGSTPPADSPAAEPKDENKPKGIADAVRAALSAGKEQSSGSKGEGEGQTGDPGAPADPAEGEEDPGEFSDEEIAAQKPKTQARIKKLVKQAETLNSEVTELRPQAEGFRALQDYARTNNLSSQDINTGFEIMRLMRNDPVKAYEQLTPIYSQLRALVGDVLPRDLHEQVQSGQITPQHAQELSRLRAERGVSTNLQRENAERETRERAATAEVQAKQLQADVGTAVTKWESDWKASDPDYSLKSNRVNSEIERGLLKETLLARDGKPNRLPKTVAEAVKFAEAVKKRVEQELKPLIPRKNTPINHVTGNGATSGSKPVPKTLNEAVRQALGR